MTASTLHAVALGALLTAPQTAWAAQELPPPGLPPVPAPPENPTTATKALLGKALFWDEQLSASGTMACGTCHRFEAGGSDPRPALEPAANTHPGFDGLFGTADDALGSAGVVRQRSNGAYEPAEFFGLAPQVTARRAPSVINSGFAQQLFWDGRAEGPLFDPLDGALLAPDGVALEIQAIAPPLSSVEMAHTTEDWSAIAARVAASAPLALASNLPIELAQFVAGQTYPQLFGAAFGSAEVTPQRVLFALAVYQRTLVSDQSRWDDHLAGDPNALSSQELKGRDLFFGSAKCSECHSGQLLSDLKFHDIGVRPDIEDLGRGAITGLLEDQGRFRTPSLRNVELRAPYFHNGSASSLGAVLTFYDDGGDFEADELIETLNLSPSQRLSIVAFLRTFTDPRLVAGQPPFDRPTLFSESSWVAVDAGAGTAGAAGLTPEVIAVEPAKTGATEFSLGIRRGTAGALAWLAIDGAPAGAPLQVLGAQVHLALSPGSSLLAQGPLADGAPFAAGHGTASFDLAALALPPGLNVWAQWFVLDPLAVGGLAASNAVRLTTF